MKDEKTKKRGGKEELKRILEELEKGKKISDEVEKR